MASGRVPKLMKSVRTLDSAPYRHVGPLPLGDFGLMIAYQPVVFPVSRAASNRGILARRLQDNRGPAARNAPPVAAVSGFGYNAPDPSPPPKQPLWRVLMSRFIDSKGRFFGKISIVDVLVVLVIVAVGAFIFLRVQGTGSQLVGVRTTFAVEKVRYFTVDAIHIGDQVHDESGSLIGTVVDSTTTATRVESGNSEGLAVGSDSQIYKDVILVVKGNGQKSASGAVRVGGTNLVMGKQLTLRGPLFEVKATIWAID